MRCNNHPCAPHGFDRNGSHSAGRYVCDCEGFVPARGCVGEELAARLAAAERDAARYRWLRDESWKNVAWSAKHAIIRGGYSTELDDAIDAALERQP